MNNVNLIGRLVKNPELRFTDEDLAVSNMRIAIDKKLSREKKEALEKSGKQTADFINVVAFGGLAETVSKYLRKGKRVGVTGRLQSGSYKAEDGTNRYPTDVVMNHLEIIDWPDEDEEDGEGKDTSGISGFEPAGQDIPF